MQTVHLAFIINFLFIFMNILRSRVQRKRL